MQANTKAGMERGPIEYRATDVGPVGTSTVKTHRVNLPDDYSFVNIYLSYYEWEQNEKQEYSSLRSNS